MQLKNQKLFLEKNFSGGEFFDKNSKIEVFNPASGKLIGNIPNCDINDTKNAILAAKNAFEKWKKLAGKERTKLLKNWYDLIISNKDDLGIILTTEQGKPLAEGIGEIIYGAQFVEWFAEEAKRTYGDVIPSYKQNQKIITQLEPVGVVGAGTATTCQ